jgi:membrane-associated phospholipid phosphatase
MAVAATMAFVVWTYNRPLGAVLGVLALLVGIARVVAGLHYTIDIVASIVLAILAVHAAVFIAKRIHHSFSSRQQ